jgi:uncharacterized protein (DUF2141 family)
MKHLARLLLTSLLLAGCHGRPPETPALTLPPGTAHLTAQIPGVRSAKGALGCSLFSTGEGFPGKSPIVGGASLVPARQGQMACDFPGLPAGDYAIVIFHDENGNGSLDENVFGAPTEGYGASNNKLHAASAPTWEESKVHLTDGQQQELTINLRY